MSGPMEQHRLVLKYIRADGCDMTAEVDIVESGIVIRALVSKGIEINEADEPPNGLRADERNITTLRREIAVTPAERTE